MKRTRSNFKIEDDDEIFKDLGISKLIKQNKKEENLLQTKVKAKNKTTEKISKSTEHKVLITNEDLYSEDEDKKVISKKESINIEKIKNKKNNRNKTTEKNISKNEISLETKVELKVSYKEKEKKENKIKGNKNNKIKNNKEKMPALINDKSMLGPICVRLGLCCINNLLRAQKTPIFSSRSMTLSTYKSKGKIEAITRATQNVKDLEPLLKWNHDHHIHVLRVSSDMFPHYSNTTRIDKEDQYTLDFIKEELENIGKMARELGHRLTMHPGQYNVVGTPSEDAFQKTIVDLQMHADILDMLQMDENSIMVVHGGGTYGDKEGTIKRWCTNFKRMPESIQKRLVIENDEKSFNVIDCLKVSKEIGIPVVFDNHHFECYKQTHPDEEFESIDTYIKPCLDSWTRKGLRPKFHISNQNPEKKTGAHSDFIKEFPKYYLEIPERYGVGVDIMIEAKAKEAAIMDLYERYTDHFLKHVEGEEIDDAMFKIDKSNIQAVKCPKCKL